MPRRERIRRLPVIVVAQALLAVSAVLASFADGDERLLMVGSLFLLGLGWNFGFVAASALLTESVPIGDRVGAQGAADFVVWTSAALASLSSGALLEAGSYATLSLVGAALVMVTVVTMLRHRAALVS